MTYFVDPRWFSKNQPFVSDGDIEVAQHCARNLLHLVKCSNCSSSLDWNLGSLTAECKCGAAYYSTIGKGNPVVYQVNSYRLENWKRQYLPK
jgi:hypothetical protein